MARKNTHIHMLNIIQSTDPDILFESFADTLTRSRRGVFDRATVIVPSMTVRDYLDQRLADRNGISALLDAQFFGMYAWQLVENTTGDRIYPAPPPLSRTAMQWRIFAVYAARLGATPQNAAEQLIADLTATSHELQARLARLWQLAGQFARLFTRYLHMRSDWLALWSAGRGATLPELFSADEQQQNATRPDWMRDHYQRICAAQQAVWHTCFADAYRARHERLEHFWQILAQRGTPPPAPLFVYTLENVEADMYGFLHRLAAHTDIHIYHHAISDGYFGDIVDDRWLRRLQLQGKDTQHDSIHPLLSRFGKQQRDIFRQWIAPEDDNSRHLTTLPAAHPPPSTLLATLQTEIRELNPTLLSHHTPHPQDDSLRIHACHGLMRQLEALRGELVRWFAEDPARQPADVLIVLPELDNAQNLVRTVFPPGGDYDGHRLPARLTGITPPDAQNLWLALEGLYTLPDSRFEADRVLAWLRREEVCAMLGLSPAAMNRLCDALIAAGYRRGLDQHHLGSDDGDPRFTFCYALDRLITGLWMPDTPAYRDTVPQPEHDSHGVNALCELALHWQHTWRQRGQSQAIHTWIADLRQELERRFPAPGNARRTIELALRELDSQTAALETHSPAPPVTLDFVLADIGSRLNAEHTSSEPSGIMTIGRLAAMRTLPYKLIAFIGADIADFPANPPDDRYDLSRLGNKRPGDLHPEHEDLAAFLDILIHARETLWIFYSQYQPGNSEKQLPAQPVQELITYLEEQHIDTRALIREHPANPFHSDAPGHHPAPLWQQVRQTAAGSRPARPFTPLILPDIDPGAPLDTPENLTFDELRRQLLRPLSAYLRHHELADAPERSADPSLEPLHLDGLARHKLDDHLIRHDNDPHLRHLPLLPAGAAGKTLLAERHDQLHQRRAQLLHSSGHTQLPTLHDQTVTLDNTTITLPLPPRGAPHLILHASKMRDNHRLDLWLRHLLWQQHGGHGDTWCAFADGIHSYSAVDNPARHLRAWLNIRKSLLQTPWLLPVAIGMAWAENNPDDEPGQQRILQKWRDQQPSDRESAACTLITRAQTQEHIDTLILAHAQRYAPDLYAPLIQHGTSH